MHTVQNFHAQFAKLMPGFYHDIWFACRQEHFLHVEPCCAVMHAAYIVLLALQTCSFVCC